MHIYIYIWINRTWRERGIVESRFSDEIREPFIPVEQIFEIENGPPGMSTGGFDLIMVPGI